MDLSFDVLDLRELPAHKAIEKLESMLQYKGKHDPIWIIDKEEPLQCYTYLMRRNYYFETFIISKNEFRVFVGECLN